MPTRRQVLATLSAAALAGCQGADPVSTPTDRHTSHSTASPTDRQPSPTPQSPSDPGHDVRILTNLMEWGWGRAWNQSIIPGFERQTDLTATVVFSPRKYTKLRRMARAQNLPELFTGTTRGIATYLLRDRTHPVDDIVNTLTEVNGPLLSAYPIRGAGTTHLVPHGLSMTVLNYRADIYETLGLSVPTTWSELVDNARRISESDQVDAAGFAVAGQGSEAPYRHLLTWLFSAGGNVWQWTDASHQSVTLDFAPRDVTAALEHMRTLGQYSPDPAKTHGGGIVGEWISGGAGQCLFPNAWLAGLTYGIAQEASDPEFDLHEIALQTRQAPVPLRDPALSPPTRGYVGMLGTPLFRNVDVRAARQFIRYMYHGPETQAKRNAISMRFLPPYEGVVETDVYRNSGIYRAENSHFWDLERRLLSDIAPLYRGERPRTPAARYAMQRRPNPATLHGEPPILAEMVHAVLVDGKPIDAAVRRARTRLRERLSDGQRRLS